MQLCSKTLVGLALLASVLVMVASETKVAECCKEASVSKITAPILGYRIQRKNLPCIRAVIFRTAEGEVCSHYRQDWVFQKVKELEDARRSSNTAPVPTTSSQ